MVYDNLNCNWTWTPSGTHIYEPSLKVLDKCLTHSVAPECNQLFLSCSMIKEPDQKKNRLLLPFMGWRCAAIIFQIFIAFNRVFAALAVTKYFHPTQINYLHPIKQTKRRKPMSTLLLFPGQIIWMATFLNFTRFDFKPADHINRSESSAFPSYYVSKKEFPFEQPFLRETNKGEVPSQMPRKWISLIYGQTIIFPT